MKKLKLHGEGIVIGQDALKYLETITGKRVFITTGSTSMFKNFTINKIREILENIGCVIEVYGGIPANPTTEDVLIGLAKMREFKPDTIIGVGGGSALDATKVMVLFYEYPQYNFERALREELPQKRKEVNFIAIPSTSGTGTEVTRAAVIIYKEQNLKIGLKSDAFIPDIAILDPGITLSMPKKVVAETGMDAMTHAVECYINKNLDDFTACLAKGAIEGLFKYLPLSFSKGDLVSREKVHNFQCMAGCAFNNAGLGMAHGISHAVGGMFNLGHGLLNAIALPYVLEYNSQDPEVAERLAYLGKMVDQKDFIDGIRKLNKILEIPDNLRDTGISLKDFEENFAELVNNSLKGSTVRNPIKISREDMSILLRKIYNG